MPPANLSNAYLCRLPNAHKHQIIRQFSPAPNLLSPPSSCSNLDLPLFRHHLKTSLPCTSVSYVPAFLGLQVVLFYTLSPYLGGSTSSRNSCERVHGKHIFFRPHRSEHSSVLPQPERWSLVKIQNFRLQIISPPNFEGSTPLPP